MDTIRELSNVDVYMKNPCFLCPATMKLTIFFGIITQLQTTWLMWEPLSHKDSIVRMEITPLSDIYPNLRCRKSPFRPFNSQIHLILSLSLPQFSPCLLASFSSSFSLFFSPYPSFIFAPPRYPPFPLTAPFLSLPHDLRSPPSPLSWPPLHRLLPFTAPSFLCRVAPSLSSPTLDGSGFKCSSI